MRGIVCAIFVSAAPLFSAAPPAPPAGVVHSIVIEGTSRYSKPELARATGLAVGQPVSTAAIENARQKLIDLQLFSTVSDSYRWTPGKPYQYDITYTVTDISQVFPIRFDRIKAPGDQLQTCLSKRAPFYSDEIPATDAVLKRYTAAVQACAAESGDKRELKAHVSSEDPKDIAVVFAPNAPPQNISQVEIAGTQSVDTGTLLRAANLAAIGMPLTDERVKRLLDGTLRQVYAAHGYVQVTFPKIEAVPSKDDAGVILKIQIKEGPVYNVGAIRFRGSGMDPDEVKANIPFHPGQVFSSAKLDDFRIWLQHSFKQSGHLDASVTFDTDRDDAKHLVNVVYNVAPGPVYTFAKLDVQGLDINSSPAVEQLWGEKPGKPFNPDYPDFFLKRVEERNMFDHLADTSSDYTADPASHTVIVHLYFKGGKTKQERDKEEQAKRDGRTTDGSWSPF